ncbi:MAG TPA: transposase [Streptosporangiaceae bacterium]|jgi:transposase
MYGCGPRIGEALAVRTRCRINRGTILRVREQVNPTAQLRPLKSRVEGQFRDIPLPLYVSEAIHKHTADHGATEDGYLFQGVMFAATLEQIRVPTAGRPRIRPDRVLADKGYPSKANRAWLRQHDIAATIPERDDQIAHRRKKPGRPIDFGPGQKERYKGRNVVERCFNKLKQWRGIAMRSDKTAAASTPSPSTGSTQGSATCPSSVSEMRPESGWDSCCLRQHSSAHPRRVQR